MSMLRLSLCLLLCLAFSAGATAQTPPAQPPAVVHAVGPELYNAGIAVGDLRGAVLDDAPAVVVGVDEKSATATIQYTKAWQRNKLSFTLSSPVDEKTGNATFVGSDGQTDAAKLKAEYTYLFWPEFSLFAKYKNEPPGSFPGGPEADRLVRARAFSCLAVGTELRGVRDQALREGKWTLQLEALHQKAVELPTAEEVGRYLTLTAMLPPPGSPPRPEESEAWYKKAQKFILQLGDGTGPCEELLGLAGPMYRAGILERAGLLPNGAKRHVWTVSVNGTVGRKDFTFLDRGILATSGEVKTTSDTEAPWSIGGRVGMVFLTGDLGGRPDSALVLSVSAERGYKAADAVTFCKPAEGIEPLEVCKDIASGAPGAEDSTLFSLEYRFGFKRIGIAARAFFRSIDNKEDDFGFEVPIYFLTNKDGGFQGGLALGWRDQDDDGSVAIFVGRKFDIF